jgi:hypothetical protein
MKRMLVTLFPENLLLDSLNPVLKPLEGLQEGLQEVCGNLRSSMQGCGKGRLAD